jgi:Leucine-rich repeat (LRR) protein
LRSTLSRNGITAIADNAFDGLSSVSTLYVWRARGGVPCVSVLVSARDDCRRRRRGFDHSDLSTNALDSVSDATFSGLTALTELYLASNAIASISGSAFSNSPSLTLMCVRRRARVVLCCS